MKEKKSETLSFKIEPELKKRLEQRANEEQRNMSNFVVKTLTEYLNKIDDAKKIININR